MTKATLRSLPVDTQAARGPREQVPAPTEDTTASFDSPAGGGKVQATLHPGSAQYRVLVMMLGSVAPCGWILATSWAFGRAIKLPVGVAVVIVLVPALVMLALTVYLALHGARKDGERLHNP